VEEKEIGSNEKSKRGCVQLFNGMRQRPTLKPGKSSDKEKNRSCGLVRKQTQDLDIQL